MPIKANFHRRWLQALSCAVLFFYGDISFAQSDAKTWPVKIELREKVQVNHMQVTLGDVANLSTADLATLYQWMKLPLGTAPRAGNMVSLERAELERWVRSRQFGQGAAVWTGAERVLISASEQTLAGERVIESAREELSRWLKLRVARSEVSEISEPRDVSLPQGSVELRVRPLLEGGLPSRRMLVWVDIWIDREFSRSIPVSFEVRAYQDGYVASQDMAAGSVVNPANFERREVDVADVAHENAVAVKSEADSTLWRIRRSVNKGQPVLRSQVEPAPAVTRGEQITLRTHAGLVSLEGRVEALQDGYLGQMVRVRAAAATSSVMARVAGPGMVEITER
ncbi:flagella basal body P-ring formation protein FlgA [Collimonas fungivorans]|uniref:Flagella basal body P-ring formation protein FlgA n=1 Tax=Collimonas fungivorans TaxID=158899 RepID=A0A127PCN1_9BURK|nr:flagellar basal body P-ring formation chaperone FlgA [Collimonas fungivorans]AMO95589.1 flagella basal body P-ring formation protein FlgA [Collimonas fungivorans]